MRFGRRLARDATLTLIVLGSANACATSATPSASPTGDPGPSLVAVPTQAPGPSTATPQACMSALLEGVLIGDPRWGIGLQATSGGLVRKVLWPYGFAARSDGGRLALIDATGHVVGHVGDRVRVGGGEGDASGTWVACANDISLVQGG